MRSTAQRRPTAIAGLARWLSATRPPADGRVLLAVFALGAAASVGLMLVHGALGTRWIAEDILTRINDVENYGRFRGAGLIDALGPAYGPIVARNVTAPALLAAFLYRLTGSDLTVRLTFGMLYGGGFLVAVPFLLHATRLTRLTTTAYVGIGLGVLAFGFNEGIYGYFPYPIITGIAASGLFCVTLGYALLGRLRMASGMALLHLAVHPTTAVAWLPVWLSVAAEKAGWLRRLPRPILYAAMALLPVLGGVAGLALESVAGVFSAADPASYWAIMQVRSFHTIFWSTERYYLTVVYLGMVAALFLLGRGEPRPHMRHLAYSTACYGAGLFALYAIFVEGELSMLAAVLLPLRFAVPMYLVLVTFMLADLFRADGVRYESRLLGGIMCLSLLSPVPGNPLSAVYNWALARLYLVRVWSAGKAIAMALGIMAAGWLLLTLLPHSGDSSGGLLPGIVGRMPWLMRAYTRVLPAATLTSEHVIFGLYFAAMVGVAAFARMVGALEASPRRRWLAGPRFQIALWAVAAVVTVPIVLLGLARTFPPGNARAELAYLATPRGERPVSPEREVLDWLNAHVTPGTRILGDPNVYFRRVFPGNFVTDDDLLGIIPYAPDLAAQVVREYIDTYGVDMIALARQRGRTWHVLVPERWVAARDRMLRAPIDDTRYILEPVVHPVSQVREPVFANGGYRIYQLP